MLSVAGIAQLAEQWLRKQLVGGRVTDPV